MAKKQSIPSILIVDDEAFVREAVELCVASEGFHVFSASGGEEALEILDKETIELAILDILMPGMDGISLLREISRCFPRTEILLLFLMVKFTIFKKKSLMGTCEN